MKQMIKGMMLNNTHLTTYQKCECTKGDNSLNIDNLQNFLVVMVEVGFHIGVFCSVMYSFLTDMYPGCANGMEFIDMNKIAGRLALMFSQVIDC